MVMCWVPLCHHYSEQGKCRYCGRYFRFPANAEIKRQWIELIRRTTPPTSNSLVCSCHFIDGDRINLPTIFQQKDNEKVKRKFHFSTPDQRKRAPKSSPRKETQVGKIAKCLEQTTLREIQNEPLAQPLDETSEEVLNASAGPSCVQSYTEEPQPSSSTPQESRTHSRVSAASTEAEIYFLKQEIAMLRTELENLRCRFGYGHIAKKDAHILLYTGIPSHFLYEALFALMKKFELQYYLKWNVEIIPIKDQLCMCLMKLRLNLPHLDLAIRFGCSTATVSNVFMTWLYALHEILFKKMMADIPSRDKNAACLPVAFSTFTSCQIVLDCTEMYSIVPKNLAKQKLTYSQYKHKNTWKVLIGIAPNGVITYVSQAYPGSTSDQKIVAHSGILNKMTPGDLILADKGFLIKDLLPVGVSINIPPFLTTPQFTEQQVYETQRIARARIHVERAIRRLKCYHILDRVPQFLIPHLSVIVQTCAALTNFQYPLIKEVEEYFPL